jgi:hypothetical protein
MFKLKTLRDAIELARMRDDNLSRDRKIASGEGPTVSTNLVGYSTHTIRPYSSGAAKKLSWEEMQKEGRKACVSVAMKSSHRDIVAKHLKHSLLKFHNSNGGKV